MEFTRSWIVAYYVLLVITSVECQITSAPADKQVCVGTDVDIDWVYGDAANFATVTWTYIDSVSAETIIMQQNIGGSATVINNYKVVHKSNGGITLKAVTLSNSGSYKITVTYLSASPVDDTVSVTVSDCSTTTPAGCDCECCCKPRFYFEIIWSVFVLVGLVAGVICVCLTDLVGENFKDIPIWVWFLCPFAIGLGILIVWLIWKKGGLKQCCNINNGCKAGFVGGGFVLVGAYLGNQIGSIVYVCLKDDSGNCCKDEDKNTCCTDKDLCGDIGIWIWIVCPCIIGAVTMIVGLIVEIVVFKAYCNDRTGEVQEGGNQHIDHQMYDGRGGRHRALPPLEGSKGAQLTTHRQHHRKKKRQSRKLEDSNSAVSRNQVELQESVHSLTKRPMPEIPKGGQGKGHDNKIHDSNRQDS